MNAEWEEIDVRGCYSLVKITFAPICAENTLDESDATMLVPHVHMTSQINCGDIKMLSQKRSSYEQKSRNQRSVIGFSRIVCSGHKRVRNKKNKKIHSLPGITIFWSLVTRFAIDFHSWLRHSLILLSIRLTRYPKIVVHGNSDITLSLYIYIYISHNALFQLE